MNAQQKIKNRLLVVGMTAVVATFSSGLLGADQDQPRWKTTPSDHAQRRALMTSSGNSGAVLFAPGVLSQGSYYTYQRDQSPEYARRDAQLSLTTPDATGGWMAWPAQVRPDLDDRDYFSTSTNPNTFVFPGTGGYSSYNRYQRSVRRSRSFSGHGRGMIRSGGGRGAWTNRAGIR